jgi:hypothetical protein
MGNDRDSSDQRLSGSIGEQHGVALVLVEDGAGWTRPEAGRRHGGALAAKKIAHAARRSRPWLDTASLRDAEGQHGDEEGGAGEAALGLRRTSLARLGPAQGWEV